MQECRLGQLTQVYWSWSRLFLIHFESSGVTPNFFLIIYYKKLQIEFSLIVLCKDQVLTEFTNNTSLNQKIIGCIIVILNLLAQALHPFLYTQLNMLLYGSLDQYNNLNMHILLYL